MPRAARSPRWRWRGKATRAAGTGNSPCDGSVASPAAIAQILGALHPDWNVRATHDSISIDSETAQSSVLGELALPRNLLLKRNKNDNHAVPIGTGAFRVADWQPGKLLKLAANEESWAGRPFVDGVEIEFGKSLHDQALAFELNKVDIIDGAPQSAVGSSGRSSSFASSSSLSLPVELMALVFPANSKAQDPHLREAIALAIDRKPMQSVLLKGVGEPAANILPNWMTGYDSVFSTQPNPQRSRSLLAQSREPVLHLSYDPRDPQAQLIAERIALNVREVGVTLQVSLSGAEDLRLMRVVLPGSDPVTALYEAARQLGLASPAFPATSSAKTIEDLYRAERTMLADYAVLPLFHLPVASAANARVLGWKPGLTGEWDADGYTLGDIWLGDARPEAGSR